MKHHYDMLRALAGLVAIHSVSLAGTPEEPFGSGAREALEYTLSLCRRLGFRTKNCSNQVGWAEIGSGETLIGILVHLDVVPAGDGWTYPPFACTEDNGRLYGRGTLDDKGPAVAAIFAMRDLLQSGAALNKRIRIIFGLSEERGTWPDMEFYRATQELPAYGFTPDAEFPVLCGEKGIARVRASVPLAGSGVTRLSGGQAVNMVPSRCTAVVDGQTVEADGVCAHGSTPEEGKNAIAVLMERLAELPVAQFYHRCLRGLHGEGLDCALEDAESGPLTLNVGTVRTEGGRISFTLDIRYPVTCTMEQVQTRLTRVLEAEGAEVEVLSCQAPVHLDKNGPLISTLMAAYQEVTGDRTSQPGIIGGGTYAKAMDNIAVFGPVLPGHPATEHQADEYIEKEDFFLLRTLYRTALEKLLAL